MSQVHSDHPGEHGLMSLLRMWLNPRLLELDLDQTVGHFRHSGTSARRAVLETLVARLDGTQLLSDRRAFIESVLQCEQECPDEEDAEVATGIVVPYSVSPSVRYPAIALATSDAGLPWQDNPGTVNVVVLVASPPSLRDLVPEVRLKLYERAKEELYLLRTARVPHDILHALTT